MAMKRAPEWYDAHPHDAARNPQLALITEGRIDLDAESAQALIRAFEADPPRLELLPIGNVEMVGTTTLSPPTSDPARTFSLTIEGEPVPKLQGQILKLGHHMSIKKNPKTRAYEDVVRERATHVWNGRPLILDQPIEMTVRFYRRIPKSMSKRDQARARAGFLRPITKPDCTNYVKAFEDGLNKVIFADDALIVTSHVEKWYAERPRVEVTLAW